MTLTDYLLILLIIISIIGIISIIILLRKKPTSSPTNKTISSYKSGLSTFFQLDESQIEIAYNTIDDKAFIPEKNSATQKTSYEVILPSGGTIEYADINVLNQIATGKTSIEKLDIYVQYLIQQNNLTLDLEHLLLDDNALQTFEKFLKTLSSYNCLSVSKEEIENQRKVIQNETARRLIDDNLASHQFNCLIANCTFKIIKGKTKEIPYELIMEHPMSKKLDKEILICVTPHIKNLTDNGKAQFERNLNQSMAFTIFGRARRVFNDDTFSILVQPTSIS